MGQMLTEGLLTTVLLSILAFVIGAVLALPVALLRSSPLPAVRFLVAASVELIRAVPPIVWLLIAYLGISFGSVKLSSFQCAVLVLSIVTAAYLSEIYRSGINSVEQGQWEAASALGLTSADGFRTVIVHQAVPLILPSAASFAIGLLKDTAVASVIGTRDMTFFAFQEGRVGGNGIFVFVIAGAIYVLLSIPVGQAARMASTALERRLQGSHV